MGDYISYLLLELENEFKIKQLNKEAIMEHIAKDLTEGKISPPIDYTENMRNIINRRRIDNDDKSIDFKPANSPEILKSEFQFNRIPCIDYDNLNDVYLIYDSEDHDYAVAAAVATHLKGFGVKVYFDHVASGDDVQMTRVKNLLKSFTVVIIAHKGYIDRLKDRSFTLNHISERDESFKTLEAELWTAYMYYKRVFIILTNTTHTSYKLQNTRFPEIVKVLHSDAGNITDLRVDVGREISEDGKYQLKLLVDKIKHVKKDSISSFKQQLEGFITLENKKLKSLNFKIVKDSYDRVSIINLVVKSTLAISLAVIIFKFKN